MFHRMLRLDAATRAAYSGRSMVCVPSTAPRARPPQVKRAMIDWWGAGAGRVLLRHRAWSRTLISSQEWLAHPGSVGRPRGCVAPLDAEGAELPAGSIGTIT